MIRRVLLSATALLVLGGASSAFADVISNGDGKPGTVICLATSGGGNSPRDGVCVWAPLSPER